MAKGKTSAPRTYSYDQERAYYGGKWPEAAKPFHHLEPYLSAWLDPADTFGGKRALDIGAGECIYSRIIAERLGAAEVVALDLFAERMLGVKGQEVLVPTNTFLATGGGHVYTTSKIATELLCHDFHKLYGLSFTILRYGIPYGPRMWSGLVLRSFLDNAFAGKPLTIYGDGSASRRFVYVEDLARAHVHALQDVASNQVYNLEGMRFVTVKELAEMVQKLLGNIEIQYREEPSRIGEFQYIRKLINSNKAYIELGWEPRIDLEKGVRKVVEWYKEETLGRKRMAAGQHP